METNTPPKQPPSITPQLQAVLDEFKQNPVFLTPPNRPNSGPHWMLSPKGWSFPICYGVDGGLSVAVLFWGTPATPLEASLQMVRQQLMQLFEPAAAAIEVVKGDEAVKSILELP